jgi:hypothetical protein
MSEKTKGDFLAPVPSQIGEIEEGAAHDAVFGEITEDGPNYRAVRLIPFLHGPWSGVGH